MSAASSPSSVGSALLLRIPGGSFLHEKTLWRHRGLLLQLVRADLRSRYVATSMGFFWSVIHPLLLLLVYIFVFSAILAQRWENLGIAFRGNFAVYFCSGMLPWMWFSESLSGACASIVAHGHLIRKNVFPIVVLPMQHIISGLINFAIGFSIFLVFRLAAFGWPGAWFLALPAVIALQFAFLVGLSYLVALINVFWRDMAQVLQSALMIWLWLTPIFYLPVLFQGPLTNLAGPHAYGALLWIFRVNPMFHLVGLYQRLLYFTSTPEWQPAPWVSVAYLLTLSVALWFVARRLYGRAQSRVVETV
jgi:lipopolysaccharide transport system permease protein